MVNSLKSNKRVGYLIRLILMLVLTITISGFTNEMKAEAQTQTFYQKVCSGIESRSAEIDVSSYKYTSVEDVRMLCQNILMKNPQYFYVGTSITIGTTNQSSGTIVSSVKFTYTYSADEVKSMMTRVNHEVGTILAEVNSSMSDIEKALVVHDYFMINYEYDTGASIDPDSYNIYGLFVKKKAVCQGYALGYRYILNNYLGIDCSVVTSDSMKHAWNMVKINGNYYHIDVTSNDPVPNQYGGGTHTFFMCSDEKMKANNYYNWTAQGKATSTAYDNYFWTNVNSGIFYNNGNWYYADTSGNINSYNFTTNQVKTIYTVTEKWKQWGGNINYFTSFVKVAMDGDIIYFNTPSAIYSIKIDGTNLTTISNVDTSDGYVYGLAFKDNVLFITKKQSPFETDKLVNVNVNKQNIKQAVSVIFTPAKFNGDDSLISITQIKANYSSKKIIKGKKFQIKITAYPTNSTNKNMTYKSSDTKVATVSKTGKVNALKIGKCTITVKSKEDSTLKVKIKIIVSPDTVSKLTISKVSSKNKLTWKKQSGITGYEIYKSSKKNGTYKVTGTVKGAAVNTFTDSKSSGVCYYKIRAYKTVSGSKIYGYFSSVAGK